MTCGTAKKKKKSCFVFQENLVNVKKEMYFAYELTMHVILYFAI